MGNYAKAIEQFRKVSETLPLGTENVTALLDLAQALQASGNRADARRATDAVMALPNYEWWDRAGERFCPLVRRIGNSKYMARKLIEK